jgi:glucose/mannose-6-phosphate isomerase
MIANFKHKQQLFKGLEVAKMLDDLKLIHQRDVQDALGIAEKQAAQLTKTYDQPSFEHPEIDNIVLAGMGGSALAGLVALSWPGFSLPFEIVRNYSLPAYVSPKTLFIASSYSGNTEETISALDEAEKRGAVIAVIASGGKLVERAQAKSYPLLVLPAGLQPRHAVFFSLKALLTLTDAIGLTNNKAEELAGKADFLNSAVKAWLPTVPTKQNQAKQIALDCGPLMFPAAYKWKISFNENAKHVAWCNQYSEFNHNEFIGWSKQPVDKPYTVIDIRSELEHPQIQKRFEISAKLLSGVRPDPIVVKPEGADLLEQLLWTIALGDFVTIYTALLSNINPTPVDLIEKLKIALS